MTENLCWIDGQLPAGSGRVGVMPHPFGDDALPGEIRGFHVEGVDVIVSLLEREEALSVGLAREEELCGEQGIVFRSFPIPDRSVPESMGEVRELVRCLRGELAAGRSVVFHCWAGIGRSSLMAASLLVTCGLSPDVAFERIGEARGLHVPDTEQQRTWVERFAGSLGQAD